MLRYLIGATLAVVGLALSAYAISNPPTNDPYPTLAVLVAGLILAFLGVAFALARPSPKGEDYDILLGRTEMTSQGLVQQHINEASYIRYPVVGIPGSVADYRKNPKQDEKKYD